MNEVSRFIALPAGLVSLRPGTLCLIQAGYMSVLALCRTLWANAMRDGWIALQDLPCTLEEGALDTYVGELQFGVLGESVSRPGYTSLWTTDAGSSLLTRLAMRLRCRVISTTFCKDWSDADALAALTILDGRSLFKERVIQVMRGDNGRFEYFERGEPENFERTENYLKRLLKDRISESVLLSYWQNLGIDVETELTNWSGRAGVAYVRANRTPIVAGTAFQAR